MARIIDFIIRSWFGGLLALAVVFPVERAHAAEFTGIHALLVGGGPDKEDNTAQIEEHLRYVTSLVAPSPGRIVLFADGKTGSKNLSYTDSTHLSPAQQALDVLLPNDGLGAKVMTRTPQIGAPLDGPSQLLAITRAFHRIAGASGKDASPVLVYFAGHGSQSDEEDDKNKASLYDLWGDDDLDPPTLAKEIETLPPRVPVVLVMAQCFSGGFGNVIYKKASVSAGPGDRQIIGFFAAENDREAAGCGTETNSPLYQDFSSYFFGALSGRDKLGHKIDGADYAGEGRVTFHDAWCYALIHDQSIDTPVCTSLVYLRDATNLPDSTIYTTPWSEIVKSATPAEKAALDQLSTRLGLTGEQRLLAAYDRYMFEDPVGRPEQFHTYHDAQDKLASLRKSCLDGLFAKWPALRWHDSSHEYDRAVREVSQALGKDPTQCQALVASRAAFDAADETIDEEEPMLVRICDVAELVARRAYLRKQGSAEARAKFEAIWKAENGSFPAKAN
jgi:hypothetical protein